MVGFDRDDGRCQQQDSFGVSLLPRKALWAALGLMEDIETHGLFCWLYTDRGSYYRHTPEAGGKVDKENLTQVGRGLQPLGMELIPAYSSEARGFSERMFGIFQKCLPQELRFREITIMENAN